MGGFILLYYFELLGVINREVRGGR